MLPSKGLSHLRCTDVLTYRRTNDRDPLPADLNFPVFKVNREQRQEATEARSGGLKKKKVTRIQTNVLDANVTGVLYPCLRCLV